MNLSLATIKRLLDREPVWASVILLVLLHICFFPCIWSSKTLLESARDQPSIMPQGAFAGTPQQITFPKMLDTGAVAWQTEPFLALIGKDYAGERTLPLWNPYQAYGVPLAADMISQPFYPLSVALALDLTPRTYSWAVLLRLFLSGICSFLFIRMFVSFIPAMAAGVTSMFAGYYVLFITMPHLSVEVLLPAALLSGEHLLRRPRYWQVVAFAGVTFLVMVGGMPESSLLLLSFLYLYLGFRIMVDPRLRVGWLRRTTYVLIATVAGFALSAFLLLPFREYMALGFDMHQPSNIGGKIPGLVHDPRNLSVLTYLFPLLYGPPFSGTIAPGWNGLRNYAGLISLFLAILAVAGSSWRGRGRERVLSSLTYFFTFVAIAVILKRYGWAPVNFIGALPLFQLVQFPKYAEVILSICVSMLCAIGLERIIRRQVGMPAQIAALTATFLAAPVALILSRKLLAKEILVSQIAPGFPVWALSLPVCLLFCVALSLIVYRSGISENLRGKNFTLGLAVVMFVLLTGETTLNYIVPIYYGFDNPMPRRVDNPYKGAPFIDHLQAQPGRYRLFAEDRILFPNWPSAFGLFDIRSLNAMYYGRYFPFLRNFFPPKVRKYGEELEDRFTGLGGLDPNNFLHKRLLQLSSVKYFLTLKELTENDGIVAEILKQNQGHIEKGKENFISPQRFVVDGVARESLGEAAPYDRLPYSFAVEKGKEKLYFSYALNPAVFEHTCGDGVEFVLEAKDASGTIAKLFSAYIDPKHNAGERHWVDGEADLQPYVGQRIELLLSTNGGPKGDICNDWAAWSNFHFDGTQKQDDGPFKLAYDHEIKIYQYGNVLPRASIYYKAVVEKNDGEVLKELADPNLDVFQSVVLDGSKLEAPELAAVEDVNAALPSQIKFADIKSYESRAVTIEAQLERKGILVLNDSNYPGWEVEVDGRKDKLFDANYLFRGVILPAGKHTVRFTYTPLSFRVGVALSLASLTCLAAWGCILSFTGPKGRVSRNSRSSVVGGVHQAG